MPVIEGIENIVLGILASLCANRIDEHLKVKDIKTIFNKTDEKIVDLVRKEVKEQYIQEKICEQIGNEKISESKNIKIINDSQRKEFISDFYQHNPDLKYLGNEDISIYLNKYIDLINDELNKVISDETKLMLNNMSSSKKEIITSSDANKESIIEQQRSSERKILDKLDEISQEKLLIHRHMRNYNLPSCSKVFSGRKEEILEVDRLLKKSNIVFINGLGGIGKTQIATKYVSEHQEEYSLCIWISAENIEGLNEAYKRVAYVYKLIVENRDYSQEVIKDLVKHFIEEQDKPLLIIDGVDDVEINVLMDYLPCGTCNTIITTQNSNIDKDEHSIVPVRDFSEKDSIQFLLTYTSQRKISLDDENNARKLAKLMLNYPLALEYARSYINKRRIPISEYIDLYKKNSINILNSNMTSYKKTIYTAWKLAFDKVVGKNNNTYEFLALCAFFEPNYIPANSIFRGRYESTIFSEMIDDMLNYSLISVNGSFINIHGIVQEFIRQMLCKKKESCKFLEEDIKLLISIIPHKINSENEKVMMMELLPHARQVFNFSEKDNVAKIGEFGGEVGIKLYAIGMYSDAIDYFSRSRKLCYRDKEYFKYCEYSLFIVQAYHYIGETKSALDIAGKVIEFIDSTSLLDEREKDYLVGVLKGAIGIIFKDSGRIEEALSCFEKALECFESIDHVEGKADQLINIGIIYKYQGKLDLALVIYKKALELCEEDKRNRAKILGNIGCIYKANNEFEEAYEYFEETLKIAREVGDLRSECICLEHLGECEIYRRDTKQCIFYLDNALKIAKQIDFKIGEANIYNSYGVFYLDLVGDYKKAKEYFIEAMSLCNVINYVQGMKCSKYYLNMIANN